LKEKLHKTAEQLTEQANANAALTLNADANENETEHETKAEPEPVEIASEEVAQSQSQEKKPEEGYVTPRQTAEPDAKRKHHVGEKEAIHLETSPVAIQRKTFNGEFEDKLKSIQEESHREVVKLTQLLESAEAGNQEKLVALEDKERRLRELEE